MSFLRRLRNVARLSAPERRLALRACGALALTRVAVAVMPFRSLRRGIDRFAGSRQLVDDATHARAVQLAMARAARVVPGARCLAQALAAEILLRRDGRTARLTIGVARDGAPLEAHAWVESAGVLVSGEVEDLGKFRTLVVFGGPEPTPASTHPSRAG